MRTLTLLVAVSLAGVLSSPAALSRDAGQSATGKAAQPGAKPARKAVAPRARNPMAEAVAPAAAPSAPAVQTTFEARLLAAQPAPEAIPGALPIVKLVPPPAQTSALGLKEAALRYVDGLVEESRGDEKGAHTAFLQAAEGGYAPAQKKLGQIYDRGNSVVRRDYAESLRWYQRARDQGADVPEPFTARSTTAVR